MKPETTKRLEEIESLLSEINPCLPPYMEMRHYTMDSWLPGVRVILSLGLWRREFLIEPHEEKEWSAYREWCEKFTLEQVGELAKQYTRELLKNGEESR